MMNATIRLLSMLISLAMMLTGTYGAETPEAAARTLTLSNAAVTVNGETVKLNPGVSMGVASEAGKALFDFAVNLGDKRLFPVQVAVTEEALTALAGNADAAVTVPAAAFDSLVELAGRQASAVDAASAEMLKFLSGELIPAYTRVMKKAYDPALQQEMAARSEELLAQVADRGEGEPDVVEIDGATYDVTRYEYTLSNEQLMELADLVYTSDEDFEALYKALFRFYDMLPEESGLKGIDSFADLYETMGAEMTADIVERRNEDGMVQVTEAVFTMDFSGLVARTGAAGDSEGDSEDDEAVGVIGGADGASETVEAGSDANLPPMVIEVYGEKLGNRTGNTMHTEYEVEGVTIAMDGNTAQEDDLMSVDLSMEMDAGEDGNMVYVVSGARTDTSRQFNLDLSFSDFAGEGEGFNLSGEYTGGAAADAADWEYNLSADMEIRSGDDGGSGSMTVQGVNRGDGSSSATVALGGEFAGWTVGLVFDADVSTEPIEDVASGREGLVIDDLQKAGEILGDEANQGLLTQIAGSFMADAGALMQDESVAAVPGLFERLAEATAIDGPVVEDDFAPDEGEEEDEYDEYDKEDEDDEELAEIEPDIEYGESVEGDAGEQEVEPEDDGVLPYDEPSFGFLPEGMQILETEVDTAYDSVNISISDDSYENMIYAVFNPQREGDAPSYTMDAEGNLVQTDGNAVQISQPEPGSWVVNMTRDGVAADLYINSETIDVDTIARIINGIAF